MRGRFEDITGQRFGRLVVEGIHERRNSKIYWLCWCDCGGTAITRADFLKTGHTTSCGCYHEELIKEGTNTTHKMWDSKTYKSYYAMVQRCTNPNHQHYHLYKNRNICDRWTERNGFINFLEDMGERPEGMTLDRIDNMKGYDKDNCRWVKHLEQMRNTNRSKWWFVEGIRYESAKDASDKLGIPEKTIRNWCDGPYGSRENCWSESKY